MHSFSLGGEKRVQFGLVGYNARQTTDKTGPTITPEQSKAHYKVNALGVGSNLSLSAKINVGFKYFQEFSNRSTFQGHSIQFSGSIQILNMLDVLVIGGGPAGVVAAMRAGDLGAKTALVTEGEFGGMAANDGPVPVRTLAHAARLIRDARQLGRYGIQVGEPLLDYSQLLERVREVVDDVRAHSTFRSQTRFGRGAGS